MVVRPRGEGNDDDEEEEEKEEEEEREVGKIGCRLYLASMGEGVSTVFKKTRPLGLSDPPAQDKVVVLHSTEHFTRRPEIARGRKAILGPSNESESAYETREHSPLLTLVHPRSSCLTRSPVRAAGGGRAPRVSSGQIYPPTKSLFPVERLSGSRQYPQHGQMQTIFLAAPS
jgi:hypothetical protein